LFALKRSLSSRIFYLAALALFVGLLLPFFRFHFTSWGFRWLYIFLFSFLLSFLLTPFMMVVALKAGIIDSPDQRKIHKNGTPLLGGIAVAIAFSLSLAANMVLDKEILLLLSGGMIMALLGLLDDVKGMQALTKLLIQILVVVFLVHHGIILDLFPPRTTWGFWVNLLFTMIWIVGITNAMNFIDGMDGLATGLSAIMAAFIGIVAFQTDQPSMGWIATAILGSCLGFLPFNFRLAKPALIFLGDAGSTFLGFMLAGLAVMGYWSESRIVSFANPVLIFWVLIFDMTYITIERVANGKVRTLKGLIDYVGTDHLHHRLFYLLGDKRKAVLTIFLFSIALGISSIVLRNARMIDSILLVIQAGLIAIIFSLLEYVGRKSQKG
jgi:UDP-GlcNAc:undecaprenyl-phosphate GlcNAc-1-phosphate transferase